MAAGAIAADEITAGAIAAGAISADLTVCAGLGDSSASGLGGNVEPPSSHHLGMRDNVRSQTVPTLHYYKHSHGLSLSLHTHSHYSPLSHYTKVVAKPQRWMSEHATQTIPTY